LNGYGKEGCREGGYIEGVQMIRDRDLGSRDGEEGGSGLIHRGSRDGKG
jgi:hypothetical protein